MTTDNSGAEFSLPLKSILMDMLDLSCLALGEAQAWRLQVTLQILENDGNLNDACLLAAVAALIDTRLPTTRQNLQTGRIEIVETTNNDEGSLLKYKYIPVPLTLGIYVTDEKTFLLADPAEEEEPLLQGHLTMVVKLDKDNDDKPKIVHLQHSCTTFGLKREDLAVGAHMAYGRDKEIRELLA